MTSSEQQVPMMPVEHVYISGENFDTNAHKIVVKNITSDVPEQKITTETKSQFSTTNSSCSERLSNQQSNEEDPLVSCQNILAHDVDLKGRNDVRIATEEEIKYSCDICDRKFSYKKNLEMHKLRHAENCTYENKYFCEICDKGFALKSILKRHQNQHNAKRYICEECGRPFRTEILLNRHKLTHMKRKDHICELCNKAFANISLLKQHIITHTGECTFECPVCSKKLNDRNSIARHMNLHSNDRPHVCNYCGKGYIQKQTLKEHLLSHTGEKRNACNICGKRFVHRSTLRNHKYLHSDVKRYICEMCGKGFNHKKSISDHECNQPRPFCKICNKTFAHSGSLLRHTRIHTGDKKYQCNICLKRFIQKTNLNSHMQSQKCEPRNSSDVSKPSVIVKSIPTYSRKQKCHICQVCQKGFSTKYHLDFHKKNHIDKKGDVHKNFDSNVAIDDFVDTIIETSDTENIFEETLMQSKLTFHEAFEESVKQQKHDGRTYLCDICFKSFSDKHCLLKHKAFHAAKKLDDSNDANLQELSKKRPFNTRKMDLLCDICNIRFNDEVTLQNHKLTHNIQTHSDAAKLDRVESSENDFDTESPYKCGVCRRTFVNKVSLELHEKTHTPSGSNEKPTKNALTKAIEQSMAAPIKKEAYYCSVCKLKFINKLSLSKHMEIHTVESWNEQKSTKRIENVSSRQNKSSTAAPSNETKKVTQAIGILQTKSASQNEIAPKNKQISNCNNVVFLLPQKHVEQNKKLLNTDKVKNTIEVSTPVSTKTGIPNTPNSSVQLVLLAVQPTEKSDISNNPNQLQNSNKQKFILAVIPNSQHKPTTNNLCNTKIEINTTKQENTEAQKATNCTELVKGVQNEILLDCKAFDSAQKCNEVSSLPIPPQISPTSHEDVVTSSRQEQSVKNSGMRYVCNICYNIFPQKELLQEHMLTHTDFNMYECADCLKVFGHENALRVHTMMHSIHENMVD